MLGIFGLSRRTDLLCSQCFQDHGLRLDAERVGISRKGRCRNCGRPDGKKLDKALLHDLADSFFVNGTRSGGDFGIAPIVVCNDLSTTSVEFYGQLQSDAALLARTLGIGFFHYGPPLWMFGQIGPLEDLQDVERRAAVIERILKVYPVRAMSPGEILYRARLNVKNPATPDEYDGQPLSVAGKGRLDSSAFPVLYASQDLQVCVHECRATAEDKIFVGTLSPVHPIRLLNLAHILDEGTTVTEFESLDLTVAMLFLAGAHSYPMSRAIALAA